MKRRVFKYKDGRRYLYGEYGVGDIVNVRVVRKHVSDKILRSTGWYYRAGRNYNTLAMMLGKKILRLFIQILVEHLLDSDRIMLGYGRTMYIGPIRRDNRRTVAERWKNNHLFHTDGKIYGIKLDGTPYRPYFRMPFRKRKELAQKLMTGHRFYG